MERNEAESKKKRRAYPDRVTLQPDCLDIVESWKKQIGEKLEFGKVTRNDLVNWIVREKGQELTKKEVTSLAIARRDPVKELEYILVEARKMKHAGERVDVGKLLKACGSSSSKIETKHS